MATKALSIVKSAVSETSISIRLADTADPTRANEWVDVQVSLTGLIHPADPKREIGDVDLLLIAEVRLAALRHVRDVIGVEIQRLSALAGQR